MGRNLSDIYAELVSDGTITSDPAQKMVLPLFDRLNDELMAPVQQPRFWQRSAKPTPINGIYLWGGVGRGKSMLMDLAFENAPEPQKRRVHFHAFMQEIHDGMKNARAHGASDALRPVADGIISNTRLLCFDELQITDITDAMIVGRLFDALQEGGVAIIATSNRHPDDLYKNGLNRQLFLPFIAHLKDSMTVIELTSPTDYRQNRLAGRDVYFWPDDTSARQSLTDLWRDLTHASPEPLTLTIAGRALTVERVANGVAWTSFWDLCGRPLGAADYLALANAIRVLMIEHIPRLSAENYNEAKRFVTLIDALYEARVLLIASAADRPEMLYAEGTGAFEFERTVSRLREMQAADWWDNCHRH